MEARFWHNNRFSLKCKFFSTCFRFKILLWLMRETEYFGDKLFLVVSYQTVLSSWACVQQSYLVLWIVGGLEINDSNFVHFYST